MLIYFVLAIPATLVDVIPWLGAIKGSTVMHNNMLYNILRSPMLFFESTPLGRIVSRFSKDVSIADNDLPLNLSDSIYCLFQVCTKIELLNFLP